MTTYVWVDSPVARTPRWCIFCRTFLPEGKRFAMLSYGPETNEWKRACIQCAQTADNVTNKPPTALDDPPAEIPKGISPLSGETVHVPEFPKLAYRQAKLSGRSAKHQVIYDDKVIWHSKNRDRTEGVIEFLTQNPKLLDQLDY